MSRFALLLICLSVVKADDDCVCDDYTDNEKNDIWDFLKKYPDGADNEGILPAVLSPLVPCGNCIEYRKKRTILPSANDQETNDIIDKEESHDIDNENSSDDSKFPLEQDPRCPIGFGRIGFRCVNFNDIF